MSRILSTHVDFVFISYTRFAWHTFWLDANFIGITNEPVIFFFVYFSFLVQHLFIISDQNVSLIHSFIEWWERRDDWLSCWIRFQTWIVDVNQFEFCFHRKLRFDSISLILIECVSVRLCLEFYVFSSMFSSTLHEFVDGSTVCIVFFVATSYIVIDVLLFDSFLFLYNKLTV